MKRTVLIVGSVALVVALALPFVFTPSDKELIDQALKDSVKASREGRPGGVLEYLSGSLTYNDIPVENRAQVANYVKSSRPEIVLLNPVPEVNGNSATVVTPVDVQAGFGPVPVSMHLDKVTITLAKETGTRFLVFPAPKWRITSIKSDQINAEQWAE